MNKKEQAKKFYKKEKLEELNQKKQYHHLRQSNSRIIDYDEFVQKQMRRVEKYKKLLAEIKKQEYETLN